MPVPHTAPALKSDDDVFPVHVISHFSGERKAAGEKNPVQRSACY